MPESTTRHVAASHSTWNGSGYSAAACDTDEGYGYQIWLQDGAYYASGMFGQFCVVVPDADRVIAVNAAFERPQARELVADLIGLAREGEGRDCRVSSAGRRVPIDAEPSELCASVAGEYMSADGASSLSVRQGAADTGAVLSLTGDDAARRLALTAGIGENRWGSSPMSGPRLHHSYVDDQLSIAARVEQTGRSELTVTIDYLSTPFVDTLTIVAATDGLLTLTRSANVTSTDASSITTAFVRRR